MSRFPLLLIGDAPSASTGLGRITRELAIRIHDHLGETFRVGTYGLGGIPSRRFPWQQYQITSLKEWVPVDLPRVWQDFAGDEKGIIFPIWNPSSLAWLADPSKLAPGLMKDFLMSDPFETWGYFPVDAEGPNGLLPKEVTDVICEFDRPLMYTTWASELVKKSSGKIVPHLPHGTDTKIFYPRDRQEMRQTFVKTVTGVEPPEPRPVHDNIFLIGIVATNTRRKAWTLGFEVCQELLARGVNVVLWAHTDLAKKHWNLPALAEAYGMKDRVVLTNTDLSDEQMAEAYCACNVILGIGLGEGWGMTHSDALACGVPVICGNYAGSTEFVPAALRVIPRGFYADDFYGHRRPVFYADEWADYVQVAVRTWDYSRSGLDEKFTWDGCWPAWAAWLEAGING
jgi:glycosyltransferase involved in cell wall biosynthesis